MEVAEYGREKNNFCLDSEKKFVLCLGYRKTKNFKNNNNNGVAKFLLFVVLLCLYVLLF